MKFFRIPAFAAGAGTGKDKRSHAAGIIERNLQDGITAHRQTNKVCLFDFQMVEYGDSVAHDMPVTVRVRIGRNIGGCVAASRISDTAVTFAEFAELVLPASMVAGELVHEQYRRAVSNFFVVEFYFVWRDGVRHFRSTLWLSLNSHRNAHQFRDVAGPDTLHHPGSMVLHGLWADFEL